MEIKIPEDASRDTLQFVQRLLGPVAEVMDFLGDRVRFYRWRSALKTIQRAKQMVDAAGIEPQQVPIKFLIPFLEKCSIEADDSELTEKWAALLAHAAAGPDAKLVTYVQVLSELDSEEAALLAHLWSGTNPHEVFRPANFRSFTDEESGINHLASNPGFTRVLPEIQFVRSAGRIVYEWHEDDVPNMNELSLVGDDRVVKLLHLQSLGLLWVSHGVFQDSGKRVECIIGQLTPLGYDFVSSCEQPSD
jgi:hypothetical protein